MVYKSEELELACGESEVMYHSLWYIRANNKPTQYYACKYDFPRPTVRIFGW